MTSKPITTAFPKTPRSRTGSHHCMQRRVTSAPRRGVSLQAGLPQQQLSVHGGVFLLDVPLQVSAVVAGDPRLAAHDLAQGLVGRGLESEILSNGVDLIPPHGLNGGENTSTFVMRNALLTHRHCGKSQSCIISLIVS